MEFRSERAEDVIFHLQLKVELVAKMVTWLFAVQPTQVEGQTLRVASDSGVHDEKITKVPFRVCAKSVYTDSFLRYPSLQTSSI